MFVFAVFVWLCCALACLAIASKKGENGCLWTAAGAAFGPIALIVVLLWPANTRALEKRGIAIGVMRKCPYCAETVKAEATKCRHCAADLPRRESALVGCPSCGKIMLASMDVCPQCRDAK